MASFGLARGALFFAPVLIANLLPVDEYGKIELAHSIAVLVALIMGFGLPSSVPLILLRGEVTARWDTMLLLCGLLSALLMVSAIFVLIGTGEMFGLPILVLLFAAILILQQLWSATLKSKGRSTGSVFLEAGFWTVMVAGAAAVTRFGLPSIAISVVMALYGAFLWLHTARDFLRSREKSRIFDLLVNLRLGGPLMFTTLLTLCTVSAGRLILGSVTDVTTVGVYAVLYRSTMLPLIGHQILNIALFRRLFTWDDEVLMRRVAVLPACVTLGVMVFWLLADRFGFLLGQRFVDTYTTHRIEGVVILGQTILWSAIAQNDLLVTRFQIAGHVARRMFFVLLVCLPGLAILTGSTTSSETLRTFVFGYSIVIFLYYIIQSAVIARRGHHFTLLWSTATVGFLASMGLMLTVEWSAI